MDALYPYVKTLHILFAIIAVGFNASYAVWLVRGQRDPAHLAFAVKGVKFMDDYIANPCYLLLLLSGLAMAFVPETLSLITPPVRLSVTPETRIRPTSTPWPNVMDARTRLVRSLWLVCVTLLGESLVLPAQRPASPEM